MVLFSFMKHINSVWELIVLHLDISPVIDCNTLVRIINTLYVYQGLEIDL